MIHRYSDWESKKGHFFSIIFFCDEDAWAWMKDLHGTTPHMTCDVVAANDFEFCWLWLPQPLGKCHARKTRFVPKWVWHWGETRLSSGKTSKKRIPSGVFAFYQQLMFIGFAFRSFDRLHKLALRFMYLHCQDLVYICQLCYKRR